VSTREAAVRGAGKIQLRWFLTKSFWANAPVPEAFAGALFAGGVLHALVASRIFRASRTARLPGLALVAAGLGLVLWAMAAAREIRIDRPAALVTRGPYVLSRNPMYLGWLLWCLGLAFVANSRWLLAATGAAGLYLHLVDIPGEEEALESMFGEQYTAYRAGTRRYL
jgi:protein-S-isoprenylcysteine O-methyltransferase Ste14